MSRLVLIFLLLILQLLSVAKYPLAIEPKPICTETVYARDSEIFRLRETAKQVSTSLKSLDWYEFLQLRMKYQQTHCVDHLCLAVLAYARSLRSAAPPTFGKSNLSEPKVEEILSEYERVEQDRLTCLEALQMPTVMNKEELSKVQTIKIDLNFLKQNLFEKIKVHSRNKKIGLGISISTMLIGIPLLMAGAYFYRHAPIVSPTGCSVDGLDFPCAWGPGRSIFMMTVSSALIVGGAVGLGVSVAY